MEVIRLKGQKLNINEPICSAVGFFDGLHRGHMALVDEVMRVAREKQYKTALMTFDHHPLFVLGQLPEERYITTMEDRKEILEKLGIDYLFIIEFNQEVASLLPQDFIQYYIFNSQIQHIVCGFDFHFGQKNMGSSKDFQDCPHLGVSVIEEVDYKGEKISSSRIRQLLEKGHIDEMNEILGRHYQIKGQVIQGRQIGRMIGFPTANIDYQSYFLPARGVYAVKFYLHEDVYLGMCNIGLNPTFTALDKPSLEVHIFDFDQDIYGEDVKIEFYTKMRSEVHFSSKEQLIKQLNQDQQQIYHFFKDLS